MEIFLKDHKFEIIPGARAGLPNSYIIGTIQVTASNLDEVRDMVQTMQKYANGTFEMTEVRRPDPDGPIIVGEIEEPKDTRPINPITGCPF